MNTTAISSGEALSRRFLGPRPHPRPQYQAPQLNYVEEKEAEKIATKKIGQKTLEGKDSELSGPNGLPEGEGILLSLEVNDVVAHEKNGGYVNIPMFANIGPSGKGRLGTLNLNMNNLTKDGEAFVKRCLGVRPTQKTPVMARIFIPKGALLEHWSENRPSKEDQAADKVAFKEEPSK